MKGSFLNKSWTGF